MMLAGWRFWPVVSLSNLVVVPFEYRMLVGNVSGLVWGTWVNLRML
jgi:protein Mpv17